jgi:hypothetical protein
MGGGRSPTGYLLLSVCRFIKNRSFSGNPINNYSVFALQKLSHC